MSLSSCDSICEEVSGTSISGSWQLLPCREALLSPPTLICLPLSFPDLSEQLCWLRNKAGEYSHQFHRPLPEHCSNLVSGSSSLPSDLLGSSRDSDFLDSTLAIAPALALNGDSWICFSSASDYWRRRFQKCAADVNIFHKFLWLTLATACPALLLCNQPLSLLEPPALSILPLAVCWLKLC